MSQLVQFTYDEHLHVVSGVSKQHVMELIQSYKSDSSTSSNDEGLTERQFRSVYLVTYSQADLTRFPTRQEFAHVVVQSFSIGTAHVVQWVCCRESHRRNGQHYHLAIKLDRNQRWMMSKRYLSREYGITVHYSSRHHNYYSAWRYVTKSDAECVESPEHPDLRNVGEPQTDRASRGRRRSSSRVQDERHIEEEDGGDDGDDVSSRVTVKKKRRLSAYAVSEIVIDKGIKSVTELHALAHDQKKNGKTDLAEFIVNRTPRVVSNVINTAWEMEEANARLERSKKSRMTLLEEAREGVCVVGCNSLWSVFAEEVLRNNNIAVKMFCTAIHELIKKGRGKHRNIILTGSMNCGKSFLLSPLKEIYNTFANPATGSFAWVGVHEAECILLNDFRWCPQMIPWHDLLLMLEGDLVHLPAPKTHFVKDICLQKDTPIFATGKSPLIYVKNGVVDQQETDMMSSRWKIFHLHHQISREQ